MSKDRFHRPIHKSAFNAREFAKSEAISLDLLELYLSGKDKKMSPQELVQAGSGSAVGDYVAEQEIQNQRSFE